MHGFETTKITVPAGRRCEDHVAIFEFDAGVVIVVADGAGGSGHGDEAARKVIDEISTVGSLALDEAAWCRVLRQIDQRISAGESTCVVAAVSANGIVGASVGDSQAWLVEDHELLALTKSQIRKPLLGSGESKPVGFSHLSSRGLLLISTDGFCNYIRKEKLLKEILWLEFSTLPGKLVEMVRLPSGELWDDIGIVACRPRRLVPRKRQYTIDETEEFDG